MMGVGLGACRKVHDMRVGFAYYLCHPIQHNNDAEMIWKLLGGVRSVNCNRSRRMNGYGTKVHNSGTEGAQDF